MLFVCLSHFANSYPFAATGASDFVPYLHAIGMIASPTFVSVSGMMAGFMLVARPKSFPDFRAKLIDRGFFLLIVAHAVLSFTVMLGGASFFYGYRIEYITDAIALAIIVGPSMVQRISSRNRLVLAAAIFAIDWCAIIFWNPVGPVVTAVKHYLVGLINAPDAGVPYPAFPAIPWFAVYLVGTVIGERVGDFYRHERRREGHLLLARIGVTALILGSTIKIGLILVKLAIPGFARLHPHLLALFSTYQKYPPGPAYVSFYAGAGLLLISGVMEAGRRGIQPVLFNQLRQIGAASLFSFVVQFLLYSAVLPRLGLNYSHMWPVLFLFSLAGVAGAAKVWNSFEGNRFLTVGIFPYLQQARVKVAFSPSATGSRLPSQLPESRNRVGQSLQDWGRSATRS